MEHLTKEIIHVIAFIIGIIGTIVILKGAIDGFILYIKKNRDFQRIRYVIGKHTLVGLDFLVSKDILEIVFIKGSEVQIMDLVLLVLVVGIIMALTTHTSIGVKEMREGMEYTKIHARHMEGDEKLNIENNSDIEHKYIELEKEEIESQKREIVLEKKLEEIQKLLGKK